MPHRHRELTSCNASLSLGRKTLNPKAKCPKKEEKGTSTIRRSLMSHNFFPFHGIRTGESSREPIWFLALTPPGLFLPDGMTQAPDDRPWPSCAVARIRKSISQTPYSFPVALIGGRDWCQGSFLKSHGSQHPEKGRRVEYRGLTAGRTGLPKEGHP